MGEIKKRLYCDRSLEEGLTHWRRGTIRVGASRVCLAPASHQRHRQAKQEAQQTSARSLTAATNHGGDGGAQHAQIVKPVGATKTAPLAFSRGSTGALRPHCGSHLNVYIYIGKRRAPQQESLYGHRFTRRGG